MKDHFSSPINLIQRQALLQKFPCFTNFSLQQYRELATCLTEVHFNAQDIIVKEEEWVDSIYIIIQGEAEVTRFINNQIIPVAILSAHEAIGLNDTGFYSTTGKRTATVTALIPLIALRLDINDLHAFLQREHLESAMYAASNQMLRMRLIKQCLPFAKLSHERLQRLAEQVIEIKVPAGTILFHQGEEGNKSYLIRSGKIAIYYNLA